MKVRQGCFETFATLRSGTTASLVRIVNEGFFLRSQFLTKNRKLDGVIREGS